MKDVIVRSEFNLNKHAHFLFPHPDSCDLSKPRTSKLSYNELDKTVQSSITISPLANEKSFSIKTYDVLVAVIKIWENLGKPNPFDKFKCSLRDIAKEMGLSDGSNVITDVAKELRRLKVTNINWLKSYSYKDTNNKLVSRSELKDMNILASITFRSNVESKDKKDFFKDAKQTVIKFSDEVANNLLNKINVPLNLKVYNSLQKKQYAKIFYIKINTFLLSKNNNNKITILTGLEVIELLGATSERYTKKYERKTFLQRLKQTLNNKQLSLTNYTLRLDIKDSKDKKDYLLICKAIKTSNERIIPIVNSDKQTIDYLVMYIVNGIGFKLDNTNNSYYTKLAKHYPEELIHRAISGLQEMLNYKATTAEPIINKQAYFTAELHRLAHGSGLLWIKDCGIDCKYQNQTIIEHKK